MQIVFNGQSLSLPSPLNLFELLNHDGLRKNTSLEQVVVAVNENFVHRQDYQTCEIKEGDLVEMLSAVVGG